MDPVTIIMESGPLGLAQLAAAGMSALVALVIGPLLMANKKAPPAVVILSMCLIPTLAIVASVVGDRQASEAVAHASAEMKQTLLARGISTGLMTRVLTAAVFGPALIAAVSGAVAGAMRGPRRKALPIAVALLSFAVAAASFARGMGDEDMVRMGLAVVYIVFGLLAAVALLGEDPDSSAPAAGALAAMTLPLVVACGEVAATNMLYTTAFQAVAHASAEMKGPLLRRAILEITSGAWLSWLAFAGGGLAAALGAYGASHPDQRPALIYPGLAAVIVGFALLSQDASQSFWMLLRGF